MPYTILEARVAGGRINKGETNASNFEANYLNWDCLENNGTPSKYHYTFLITIIIIIMIIHFVIKGTVSIISTDLHAKMTMPDLQKYP